MTLPRAILKNMTRKEEEKSAKRFIYKLKELTSRVIRGMDVDEFCAASKALKELFDSFAIIEQFDSILIVNCFNEIKISILKCERFTCGIMPCAEGFKELLAHFYEVMKEIYYYEIFGFFSTLVPPRREYGVPVKCYCGCVDFWTQEPFLDKNGKVVYKKVIRFYNNDNIRPLCMTISKKPVILEGRDKCALTDEQIEEIKNFVRKNKDIIRRHYKQELDSGDFLKAIKGENNDRFV